jgi:hypothetical protein
MLNLRFCVTHGRQQRAETGERCSLAGAQTAQQVIDHPIDSIGGRRSRRASALGEFLCEIVLLHTPSWYGGVPKSGVYENEGNLL